MNAIVRDGISRATGTSPTAQIEPFTNLTDVAFRNIRRVYEALIANRDTLGILFALDAAQTSPTEQWVTFFVETASSQLIWDERPSGVVSAVDGSWVLDRFDEAPTLSVLAVLARLVEEATVLPVGFSAEVRKRAVLFSSSRSVTASKPGSHLRLVA